jgi:hypothetical protein
VALNTIKQTTDIYIYTHKEKTTFWIRSENDPFDLQIDFISFLVLNTTFSNISAISWRPVLVVEKAGLPG